MQECYVGVRNFASPAPVTIGSRAAELHPIQGSPQLGQVTHHLHAIALQVGGNRHCAGTSSDQCHRCRERAAQRLQFSNNVGAILRINGADRNDPDAMQTTVWDGIFHPNCSIISKPMLLEPSA